MKARMCIAAALVAAFSIAASNIPGGVDWYETYRPAALELLSGRNPYSVQGFFNPIWTLVPLTLPAILPGNIGRGLQMAMGLAIFAVIAYKLGGKPVAVAAFLVSPPVLHSLINGSVDWMTLLGVILPPQIGLFFLAIKPQVAWLVCIFWLYEAWKNGGIRQVLSTFCPVVISLVVSWAVWGFYPARFGQTLTFWWNASLWPWSIPAGVALLFFALLRGSRMAALAASPCLSPYVLFHSWCGALVSLIRRQRLFLAVVAGLWIIILWRLR